MVEKSKELANLARIGKLTVEPGVPDEIKGLLISGSEQLADARNEGLALSSRFYLAYNAAHAFSLAALRWHGYRPIVGIWCFRCCHTRLDCLR